MSNLGEGILGLEPSFSRWSRVVTLDFPYLCFRLWGWEVWQEGTSLPSVFYFTGYKVLARPGVWGM